MSSALGWAIPSETVYHGGNMRLERQVQRWLEAGIIDATAAERIIAHERRASRPPGEELEIGEPEGSVPVRVSGDR